MADVAVENKVTTVAEKAPTAVVAVAKEAKADVVKAPATENGAAEVATVATDAPAATKENGSSDVAAHDVEKAAAEETPATAEAVADVVEKPEVAAEENGEKKEAVAVEESNGDSTDSTPAEAVKRKVAAEVTGAKSDAVVATPEKKAKLDEITKEDAQNGSEATEVAA